MSQDELDDSLFLVVVIAAAIAAALGFVGAVLS
jgi:hypothetical protein